MALARKHKIVSDKDFDRAFRFGKVVASQHATVRIIPNNVGRPRFGVAVSSKKFPLAVSRNKIKRSIFSEISKKIKDFKNGYDVVIVPQMNIKNNSNDIERLIGRVIKETKTISQ